jgi:hypothetical protein
MRGACIVMTAVLVCMCPVAASSPAPIHVANPQATEFLVFGIVIATDPAASLLTIRQANLLGRLHIETKSYHVKQRSSLADLHSGDRITAVFSTRDGLLHRLTRVRTAKPARNN